MKLLQRPTIEVAEQILGYYLIHELKDGTRLVGRIVETEAYLQDDPACHAYGQWQRVLKGQTPVGRSAVLFGEPGRAYVYMNYGIHWLFNVVTEKAGEAGAVLIRALEPVEGIELMKENRQSTQFHSLTNGPGKLTQAMLIDQRFNQHDLLCSPLYLERPLRTKRQSIVATTRIGISKATDKPWRFYIQDNPFVSKA